MSDAGFKANASPTRYVGAFGRFNALVDFGFLRALRSHELKVWIVLQRHAGRDDGVSYPGLKTIMTSTGLSRSYAFDALKGLREKGLIAELPDGSGIGRGNYKRWQLVVPSNASVSATARTQRKKVSSAETYSPLEKVPSEETYSKPEMAAENEFASEKGPASAAERSAIGTRKGPECRSEKVLPVGTRTDKEESKEQISNSNAADDPTREEEREAAEALDRLISERVTRKVAAQLIAEKGPQALAAVQHAIDRAERQASRGFTSERPAFIVGLVRGYEPPAAGSQPSKYTPEQAIVEAMAQQAARQAQRDAEEQALEAEHLANWQRLAALPTERFQQLEALAKAECPLAKQDLRMSRPLQAIALAELNREEAPDEVAA